MTSLRIYLNGFMGCGKSTVGPVLARRLGWSFVDLDAVIEEELGQSIASFFEAHGEAAFRDVERNCLHQTAKDEHTVVAVGGGALIDPANLAWAKAHGTVVYLELPTGLLLGRLWEGRHERPMLHEPDGEPLDRPAAKGRIEELLAARLPAYRQADVTVNASTNTAGQLARRIEAALPL